MSFRLSQGTMRLGIFGGTFNPIHYGHLRAAEESRFINNLDKVIFIPSGTPPIKISELADASARYLMTSLAIASNPYFTVSDIELRQAEKSYTINTIESLRKIYSDDKLFLILGIDAFLDMPAWKQPEKIIEIVDFIVVARPGFNLSDVITSPYIKPDESLISNIHNIKSSFFSDNIIQLQLISGRSLFFSLTTPIGISSTDLRKLIKEGGSIKYLVPEKVEHFIYKNRLYRDYKK